MNIDLATILNKYKDQKPKKNSCDIIWERSYPVSAVISIVDEYAEQFKPKWIPVYPRTKELAEMMNNNDSRLVQCLFDNGEILAFNDNHPFAIMTHVYFLPELP